MVRTYLHQIVAEFEMKGNVDMSVIEPSELLLDQSFRLFISRQRNKSSVTTYTAPELLESPATDTDRHNAPPADSAIFSIGVILFILLTGNIPFEEASSTSDPWYKLLAHEKYDKFWKVFRHFNLSDDCKQMLQHMLCPVEQRWSIEQIKQCAFYRDEIYAPWNSAEMIARFKYKYNVLEKKRTTNMRNRHSQIYRVSECLNIKEVYDFGEQCPSFPENEVEGVFDAYSSGFSYRKIYYSVAQCVEDLYKGECQFLSDAQTLICVVQTQRDKIKFGVKVYESRRWKTLHLDPEMRELAGLYEDGIYEPSYVIRFYRIEGDSFEFLRIRNQHLLCCGDVMSGLTSVQRATFRYLYQSVATKAKTENDETGPATAELLPGVNYNAYYKF
eukprot:CAMPEP_0202733792 /NCGR_PEP_ID=MMETSP1385-20130828/188348_1 /ASSEMBLY_ACC=CAM_ASM_000861 /TAXON_ID=933848 /ORGANISM="Elphidium margaritaceum" /LENGTH=386 /DNA_ID=CAMNT_0049400133 /DNA_START=173 /DNA_END=1333 /DNA_ORIENTATION=+